MQHAIVFAILAGLVGGAVLGYLGARTVSRVLSRRSPNPRVVAGFITVGFIAVIPVAFFLSFVVGGNVGGGSGAFISESVNLGSIGVPLGLAVGIAAVLAGGLTASAAVGGLVGYAVSIALRGKHAA
jgi:hypothetical protein